MFGSIKERIKASEKLKKAVLYVIVRPHRARPRWWVRTFVNPFTRTVKRGGCIRRSARLDVVPFNRFTVGCRAVIEDFSTVNNGVGDVLLGDRSRIGIGCTVIGPVTIGNDVQLAQHITVSGLNHNYEDVNRTIDSQGVSTAEVKIGDDVWIGANSVILAGVTIGNHVVVGAGSVVNRDLPSYSVCVGNPVRVVKQYDFQTGAWIKAEKK